MSTAQNPLVHCLERLNLGDDPALRARAERVYGQCARVPTKIFDNGPNCRTVVAIQLACESLSQQEGWDTKLAAQLAGCTKRQYENTVSTVRKSLNLQPNVTLESLAVAFGCTTMLAKITALWDDFREEYLSMLSRAQQAQAQEELEKVPAWKGAVVYTCAKALGENLAKTKLQSMCACTVTELNKYIKVIGDICKEDLAKLKGKEAPRSTRSSARRKRAVDEDTQQPDATQQPPDAKRRRRTAKDAAAATNTTTNTTTNSATKKATNENVPAAPNPKSGIVSMISNQHYKDTRRYKDYVVWRDALCTRLRSAASEPTS